MFKGILLLLVCSVGFGVAAQKRTALVIGNETYNNKIFFPLKGVKTDAKKMATTWTS